MASLIRYDSQIKLVSSQLKEREQEAERAALECDRLRAELNEERLAHAAVRERFEQLRAHQEQIVQRSTVRCGVRDGYLKAS
jgi:hypothetical protein